MMNVCLSVFIYPQCLIQYKEAEISFSIVYSNWLCAHVSSAFTVDITPAVFVFHFPICILKLGQKAHVRQGNVDGGQRA